MNKQYEIFYCGEYIDTVPALNEKEAVKKILQDVFFEAKEIKSQTKHKTKLQ